MSSANIVVSLQMDNSTAVCYVRKEGGGTRSKSLSFLAGLISSWCESRSIAIHAGYLPGHLNVVAENQDANRPRIENEAVQHGWWHGGAVAWWHGGNWIKESLQG